jgi:hypothetical protein
MGLTHRQVNQAALFFAHAPTLSHTFTVKGDCDTPTRRGPRTKPASKVHVFLERACYSAEISPHKMWGWVFWSLKQPSHSQPKFSLSSLHILISLPHAPSAPQWPQATIVARQAPCYALAQTTRARVDGHERGCGEGRVGEEGWMGALTHSIAHLFLY